MHLQKNVENKWTKLWLHRQRLPLRAAAHGGAKFSPLEETPGCSFR